VLYFYLAMLETQEDKDKMAVLYEMYREYLLNVARKVLHNDSDAEDALHQAFLRIANNFTNIGDVSSHQTRNYLVIIVTGIALNVQNKRRREGELFFEDIGEAEDDLVIEDQVLKYETLWDAVEQLQPMQEEILYLRYFEGLSVKEVAKRMNLSESATKKRLERARHALRKVLSEEQEENDC